LKNLYADRFAVGCEAVKIAVSSLASVNSSRVNSTLMIPDSDNSSNQSTASAASSATTPIRAMNSAFDRARQNRSVIRSYRSSTSQKLLAQNLAVGPVRQ
jgi:hypothetical protein